MQGGSGTFSVDCLVPGFGLVCVRVSCATDYFTDLSVGNVKILKTIQSGVGPRGFFLLAEAWAGNARR